jgi:hypothetical protein
VLIEYEDKADYSFDSKILEGAWLAHSTHWLIFFGVEPVLQKHVTPIKTTQNLNCVLSDVNLGPGPIFMKAIKGDEIGHRQKPRQIADNIRSM